MDSSRCTHTAGHRPHGRLRGAQTRHRRIQPDRVRDGQLEPPSKTSRPPWIWKKASPTRPMDASASMSVRLDRGLARAPPRPSRSPRPPHRHRATARTQTRRPAGFLGQRSDSGGDGDLRAGAQHPGIRAYRPDRGGSGATGQPDRPRRGRARRRPRDSDIARAIRTGTTGKGLGLGLPG